MATQVFLHDTAATWHRGQNTANLIGTTFIWLPKATGTSRGAGAVSKATNTIAGTTLGVETTDGAGGTRIEWLTPPVDQDVTISGTITGNIWANESSNSANTAINFVVDKIAATDMAITQIVKSARVTELGTGSAAVNFTATPTSTALNKGDRLRIRTFGDDAGTMGTGFTFTTTYAGTTAAASGDTYISFNETFGFQTVGGDLISQTTFPGTAGGIKGGSGVAADEAAAQSFTLASQSTLTGASLALRKALGSPADNLVVDVVSTLDGTSLASATLAASGISTTAAMVPVTFGTPVSLAAGTYYLQATRSGARDTANYLNWQYDDTSSNLYAGGKYWRRDSGSWTDAGFPLYDRGFAIAGSVDATGSTIYPTDTASDVATADVDREAWTSRGAGVANDVTNTTTGFTTPIQVTDTAGGTAVSWFTKPLTAFTLSGLVKVNRRVLESNAAANASVGAEIARVNNDGTSATVWGYANRDAAVSSGLAGEVATTETAYTIYVSGDDLAFTDGQRIRIRFFCDDCANGAMVTGHSLTSYYAGTSGGASGDTYLTFGQTLTEYAAAGPRIPILVMARRQP